MTTAVPDYGNPPPLFDVGAVWRLIWRRRLLVIAITLITISAASLYVVLTPPSYTAGASILVDPRDVKTTNIDSVLPGIGADSAAIASQVSVIESRDLLSKVYADLNLQDDPDYAGSGGGILSFLHRSAQPVNPEVAFDKFLHAISVEREGLTYVIDVTVKASTPEKAAKIANAVVDHYIAATGAQQTSVTSGVTTVLNGKIAALQDDVANAERAVADFKRQNGIFDETTGGTLQSQIDTVSGQILTAQDALNQAQSKYDQAKNAGTSPAALVQLSDVWSSPAMEGLRADYNQRAAALASAQATLGPKHPTVVQAQAELNKVQALLAREAARISRQLKSDRDLDKASLDKLQASLEALRDKAGQTNLAQVQLRQLQGKADAAHAVLADFLQRSQETSQMSGLQNQQVHVISAAAPPTEATWPKPMLLLPVSAVLGLLAGCGIAMLWPATRKSVPAPAPAPAPVTPDRPRRERTRDTRATSEPTPSNARRYASLDVARQEIFSSADTPLTTAVQKLLNDMLAELPSRGGPFVVAFSSLRDIRLAEMGASFTALGIERIGGRALVLKDGATPEVDAGQYGFILVAADHYLAGAADLDVLVLTPEEQRLRPAGAKGIVFVLTPIAAKPQLVTVTGTPVAATAS
jgi:uncharacterized protein involved in exopolysaccharide biosynthesis